MTQKELEILHFQIFGSSDSQDVDIMVFVPTISSDAKTNHDLIKELNQYYSGFYPGRSINCNLCTYDYITGTIVSVFKGTPDEVNNSMFYTYDLHEQTWNNLIMKPVKRDLEYKLIRVSRFLLSFFSRVPELRPTIKSALRGTFAERLEALSLINFYHYMAYDFSVKGEKSEDVWKVIAFQLGISVLLSEEKEVYTKNDLIEHYPELIFFLKRKEIPYYDFDMLNVLMIKFLQISKEAILKGMEFETELEYDNKYKPTYERTYLQGCDLSL